MRLLILCLGLCLCLGGLAAPASAANNCNLGSITDSDWLKPDPTTLAEVPNGDNANNCDFHIFSWQWFSYLMNPYDGDARNFENNAVHPVVDLDTCTSVKAGNMVSLGHNGVIASLPKQPDIPDQASGNALYDKNGNIVFYNRNFTVNECDVTADGNFPDPGAPNTNFPTGVDQVVELKTAWQILAANDDPSTYYTQQVTLEGEGDLTLGLIGFHIVVNTALHPEFVWATFEHVSNSPNCTVDTGEGFQRPQPANGWNLVSESCNTCVASNYTDGTDLLTACASECAWNPSLNEQPAAMLDDQGNTIIQGDASDICLIEYLGTDNPTDSSGMTNIDNIEYLNTLLAGSGGLFATTGGDMGILQYYFLAGAVWTNTDVFDPSKDMPYDTALTGSTALANASMESFSQPHSSAGAFFDTGCFSCHGGAKPTNTAKASHLLSASAGAAPGLIERCDVKAGPIADNTAAQSICPTVCGTDNWNGNWKTIVTGSVSVCGCNTCVAPQ